MQHVVYRALAQVPDIVKGRFENSFNSTVLKFLFNRGVLSEEDYKAKYSITELESPSMLSGIRKSADKLLKFIKDKKKIVIYGDYDADGIVSSYLLYDFVTNVLGYKNIWVWLPNRFNDGYGLSKKNLEYIETFADVVITVDCGIRDTKLIQQFSGQLEFMILDHHEIPDEVPKVPIVHPFMKQKAGKIAPTSAGVTVFKFISFIAQGMKLDLKLVQEHLYKYIDIASLTIVTDVMPVVGENRLLLKFAIEKGRKDPHPFIENMFFIIEKDIKKLSSSDFGFFLGPRINATGRLYDPTLSFKALYKPDNMWLKYIDEINTHRQDVVSGIQDNMFDYFKITDNKIIVVFDKNISEGVIGLVAGNLVKKYNLPAIVCTFDNNGKIKCSARSVRNVHIVDIFDKVSNCLDKYGGHSQAAGCTLKKDKSVQDFVKAINNVSVLISDIVYKDVDDVVTPVTLTASLVESLEKFAPFGTDNASYKLLLKGKITNIFKTQTGKVGLEISEKEHIVRTYFSKLNKDVYLGQKVYIYGRPFMGNNKDDVMFWGNEVIDFLEYVWIE